MARAFLTTYRPICRTRAGRAAAARFGFPSYVDGSCRREPDFESDFPSITALCRASKFAPRLREGDRIAYVTKRGAYDDLPAHWRLVALLRVVARCESHDAAAAWYAEKGLPLPRNIMVRGNPPLTLLQTDGVIPTDLRGMSPDAIIRHWDARYRKRARTWPMVLICEAEYRELHHPPIVEISDWMNWTGAIPMTRNPPEISSELWERLLQRAMGS
ncbi:MAG TPA: hypothetical protein VHK90_15065 [Thermoanaerobaculia bacterium]|nr:hypothetical protein [Thermoanaerobaculia bacterium]